VKATFSTNGCKWLYWLPTSSLDLFHGKKLCFANKIIENKGILSSHVRNVGLSGYQKRDQKQNHFLTENSSKDGGDA